MNAEEIKGLSRKIEKLEDQLTEFRRLFLYALLDKVCIEEGKLYYFAAPFQSAMQYDAVIKKGKDFYLRDEDGHFREIFINENFVRFIDDLYRELYENEEE